MKARGPLQGVGTIVCFNWPFYAAAMVALVLGILGAIFLRPPSLQIAAVLVALASAYFLVGSLGVSFLVYDRSDLYRWNWLARAVADRVAGANVFCHSGFDEASDVLRERIGGDWTVLDHFDPGRMTEASIRRARKKYPPAPGTRPAAYNHWQMPGECASMVFGILAIHELRTSAERTEWFLEAHRCLHHGGRIVLVEHTRNLPNFLAFGPGFLHFHSRKSWSECWKAAGLVSREEFPVTPWVTVFVLEKP